MFNWLLSLVLGHLPWVWLLICAVVALIIAQIPLARSWACKELIPLATIVALGFAVCWMYSATTQIDALKKQNADLDLRATQLQVSVDAYREGLADYQRDQKAIQKQIKAVKQGLSASSIIQESHNDPVKADSDLNTRWHDLDSLFDNATGGTETAASSATGADAKPAG